MQIGFRAWHFADIGTSTNGRFSPEADSSIDWAAGIEEIRQSHDRQHIDGGHTIALKAEGRGAGS
jgi:hypothetical protein